MLLHRIFGFARELAQQRWLAAFCGFSGCLLALGACSKRTAVKLEGRDEYVRGDPIVAEQAAAQFFEGRVLSVEGKRLRVQAVGGNDSLNVMQSDVYRLPPPAREFTVNMLAICGRGDSWQPCRLSQATGPLLRASSATGASFAVARDKVLVPSPLTELNLKHYFMRRQAESSFALGAERAGEPRPEPSWRPALHERLLVKLGPDWFTGYVREIADDRAKVTLNNAQRSATVSLSALAAEPPSSFVNELRRGDFVLLRPDTASDPWRRCQIRALNDKEFSLIDAAGHERSASLREVIPLRP